MPQDEPGAGGAGPGPSSLEVAPRAQRQASCRGRYPEAVASPPLSLDLLHGLEPEARLVVAIFCRAFRDLEERRVCGRERSRARAFLEGGGSFELVCAIGRLNPVQVARLACAQGV